LERRSRARGKDEGESSKGANEIWDGATAAEKKERMSKWIRKRLNQSFYIDLRPNGCIILNNNGWNLNGW